MCKALLLLVYGTEFPGFGRPAAAGFSWRIAIQPCDSCTVHPPSFMLTLKSESESESLCTTSSDLKDDCSTGSFARSGMHA